MKNHEYIKRALEILKTISVAELARIKESGTKTIRLHIEKEATMAPGKAKGPAHAIVPIGWALLVRERSEAAQSDKEEARLFGTFISDWITGWV